MPKQNSAEREAFQFDLALCRTYEERVRLFQNYLAVESARMRAERPAGGLSYLDEFSSRLSEWIEFLLKESFWWAFEETNIISCSTPAEANLKKDGALFWRISPSLASPALGDELEIFVVYRNAEALEEALFLETFYRQFCFYLAQLLGETVFRVRASALPVADFAKKYLDSIQPDFAQRLAWLKFKPVAGASSVTRAVEDARVSLVYSDQPFDFADAARERILRQSALTTHRPDVLASPGGLLDIEYLTGALQMAFGRKIPGDARSTDTLTALYGLWQAGVIGEKHYQDLRAGYVFMTGLAEALKIQAGETAASVQTLPPENSAEFLEAAHLLGYKGPDAHVYTEFKLACQHHMASAERLYEMYMVNLANQPWEEIPACVVVSQDSVRVRLDELLRGAPRPEDVPALRRMGFTNMKEIGRRFQALCPNMTAFEPFSRVMEKSWELWPEIPSPDLALENLKTFLDKNDDPYRFWYALAKSEKGLRLLLHIFGTSRYLAALFLTMRECWPWVEQTQFLSAAQTLEALEKPAGDLASFAGLTYFKNREILRLTLTDLFMGEPFDSLMQAHSQLASFLLERVSGLVPGADQTSLIGLGGFGAGAHDLGTEWNFVLVAADEPGLVSARAWLEKITGGSTEDAWTHLPAPGLESDPAFLLHAGALAARFKQTERLSQAAGWLQASVLAGSRILAQKTLQALREAWSRASWLEPAALQAALEERSRGQEVLLSKHEEQAHLVLAPGSLRDLEWTVLLAWSRRARENFQPCGLLDMLKAVESGGILSAKECAGLRETFLEFQKIKTRLWLVTGSTSGVLPADAEDFRMAAKAFGFRDQGIDTAEARFQKHLARLRAGVLPVFERVFKEARL